MNLKGSVCLENEEIDGTAFGMELLKGSVTK